MTLQLFQVDAFTDSVFSGNPAAVCPLNAWLADETMQKIALENNLSETAFFVPKDNVYEIRWFTPVCEVDLCGHATLAASFVIFNVLNENADLIEFTSKSGKLEVARNGELLVLNFPVSQAVEAEMPEFLLEGTGKMPLKILRNEFFLLALYECENDIREMKPNFSLLNKIDCPEIIVTAKGDEVDFVSRLFAPRIGIDEDPATGATHCLLTPFWAERLGKTKLRAKQLSARGGELFCELSGERVKIGGRAILYLRGEIYI